jgi:hypothetical protein
MASSAAAQALTCGRTPQVEASWDGREDVPVDAALWLNVSRRLKLSHADELTARSPSQTMPAQIVRVMLATSDAVDRPVPMTDSVLVQTEEVSSWQLTPKQPLSPRTTYQLTVCVPDRDRFSSEEGPALARCGVMARFRTGSSAATPSPEWDAAPRWTVEHGRSGKHSWEDVSLGLGSERWRPPAARLVWTGEDERVELLLLDSSGEATRRNASCVQLASLPVGETPTVFRIDPLRPNGEIGESRWVELASGELRVLSRAQVFIHELRRPSRLWWFTGALLLVTAAAGAAVVLVRRRRRS